MTNALHEEDPNPVEPERPLKEMQLRSTRAPVTRLSRKVLMGLGLVATAGIGAALFLALKPQSHAARSELYNVNNRTTPDGLANLPKDYAGLLNGAPKLGPPLPGDLGKPIVNAGAPAPGMGSPGMGAPTATATAADEQAQRVAQERQAALSSHLFSSTGAGAPTSNGVGAELAQAIQAGQAAVAGQAPASSTASGSTASTGQDQKLAFLNGNVDRSVESPDRVQTPTTHFVLQAGAVISAALLTGLRSDLPGQVTAQVTEDTYDSPTGKVLLIPQGAKLVGQYDAQVTFGQSRALLVWTRLIMPNGRSIVLERQPGADAAGYAGLSDQVDNHWGMLFKAAMLSTLLSVGAEAGTSNSENNLAQAIREGASNSFSQVGEQVVGRSLNVQPTITVRPGFPVRVLVARDLVLEPYRG